MRAGDFREPVGGRVSLIRVFDGQIVQKHDANFDIRPVERRRQGLKRVGRTDGRNSGAVQRLFSGAHLVERVADRNGAVRHDFKSKQDAATISQQGRLRHHCIPVPPHVFEHPMHVIAEIDAFRGRQNLIAISERTLTSSRASAGRARTRPWTDDRAPSPTLSRRLLGVVDGVLNRGTFRQHELVLRRRRVRHFEFQRRFRSVRLRRGRLRLNFRRSLSRFRRRRIRQLYFRRTGSGRGAGCGMGGATLRRMRGSTCTTGG